MTSTSARVRPGWANRSPRHGLAVFAAVNAVAAGGGAIALLAGWTDFGDRLDQRLPFDSLVLAGLALAAIVALPLSGLAVLAWRGDPRAGRVAVGTGVVLVAWIVVQLAFLRAFSVFQPTYVVIGVLFVVAGRRGS
ncbi:MAG: hypothetical protein ABI658_05605 [Acidimicrobiales bacterium]